MKMDSQDISIRNNLPLNIERRSVDSRMEVSLSLQSKKKCVLHWGVCRHIKAPWQIPPQSIWPAGTDAFGPNAAQTPFTTHNDVNQIKITLDQDLEFSIIAFALFFPEENYWDNNHDRNYIITLTKSGEPLILPHQALAEETTEKEIVFQQVYHLDEDRELAAAVCKEGDRYRIILIADIPGTLVLHWGVAKKSKYEWLMPPPSLRPVDTIISDNSAAQTVFVAEKGLQQLQIEVAEQDAVLGLAFVLKRSDTGKWYKKHRGNFYIPVHVSLYEETVLETQELADLAEDIVQKESGRNSWTLMHRFNLCHDLLDRVHNYVEGLALLFVWLRFSAIRQLDWQRNYNTKPRELAHAQKRLTLKLAAAYGDAAPASREIIRLMLSTLGRGGEGGKGQRIRDDILHIMHRHKIKEVSGHFMEEWHQKLHNNATPDDIVICEAYLEFLRSYGDHALFYKTLKNGGVTKKRLASFERPITTAPDFVPHIRDGLIHDFENYLQLLQSIHSATDLASAVATSSRCLNEQLQGQTAYIHQSRDDGGIDVVDRVRSITEVRGSLNIFLNEGIGEECVRDILYLDLALEEFLRVVVERDIHRGLKIKELAQLIGMLIENVRFAHDNTELAYCATQWERLLRVDTIDKNWALHSRSMLERITRILGAFSDYYYKLLQAKAEHLGHGFGAEAWTIDLFSQEIVRAGSPFVLSILLQHFDPMLRKVARLGSWQVISQTETAGHVEIATLLDIQEKIFDRSTVIITDRVTGDEEIPAGVTAVITPDVVDVLSHVSIRARNGSILFATCYDMKIIDAFKSHNGEMLQLKVNGTGDVEFAKAEEKIKSTRKRGEGSGKGPVKLMPAAFTHLAIASPNFTGMVVGGKSLQLQLLQGRLPGWIHLPRSVAISFGVCEKVLAEPGNKTVNAQYTRLTEQVDQQPGKILPELRKTLMALEGPEALVTSLPRGPTDGGPHPASS